MSEFRSNSLFAGKLHAGNLVSRILFESSLRAKEEIGTAYNEGRIIRMIGDSLSPHGTFTRILEPKYESIRMFGARHDARINVAIDKQIQIEGVWLR